jgi:hypothetical protein
MTSVKAQFSPISSYAILPPELDVVLGQPQLVGQPTLAKEMATTAMLESEDQDPHEAGQGPGALEKIDECSM